MLLKEKFTFPDKILLMYCGDTSKRSANPFRFNLLASIYSTKDKEMSLDVALDIIGTLRMMKIDEISEEKDENKKELLYKELDILTTEEEVANGLLQFEVSEKVRLSIMDKIENYYAPKLKAYYATL